MAPQRDGALPRFSRRWFGFLLLLALLLCTGWVFWTQVANSPLDVARAHVAALAHMASLLGHKEQRSKKRLKTAALANLSTRSACDQEANGEAFPHTSKGRFNISRAIKRPTTSLSLHIPTGRVNISRGQCPRFDHDARMCGRAFATDVPCRYVHGKCRLSWSSNSSNSSRSHRRSPGPPELRCPQWDLLLPAPAVSSNSSWSPQQSLPATMPSNL